MKKIHTTKIKIGTPRKNTVFVLQMEQLLRPKDADGMTNSVDHFELGVCTVYSDLSLLILSSLMV